MGGTCSTNGETRNVYRLLVGKPDGKSDLGGWIIRTWIVERWDGVMWTGLVWLRIGTSGESSCECGNEPSGSIECWEIIEWLTYRWRLW
jgi:hypothetical protein